MTHRVTRNAQQREKILAEDFKGWILDEHLVKLDGPQRDHSYTDPRHCLVFWGRPPQKVKTLIDVVQAKLVDAAPGMFAPKPSSNILTPSEISG